MAYRTILQSPFFNQSTLSTYARDVLQAPDYPVEHAAALFEPLSAEDGDGQANEPPVRVEEGTAASSSSLPGSTSRIASLPTLTPANVKALQEASQALGAHLVLLDRQAAAVGASSAEHSSLRDTAGEEGGGGRRALKLEAARVRAHLGATLILLNQPERALAQISLASDSLRPSRPRKGQASGSSASAVPASQDGGGGKERASASQAETDEVRLFLFILLERVYLLLGKEEERKRVQRWRTALRSQSSQWAYDVSRCSDDV